MAVNQDKISTIDEKSVYFQEILEKVPLWIVRWGNSLFFVVFALMLFGLSYIKYPDVVGARVKVETVNPSVIVKSLISGKVATILKKDQDYVKPDEWIIILDSDVNHENAKKIFQNLKNLESHSFWSVIDTLQLVDYDSLGVLRESYVRFSRSVQEYKLFQKIDRNNKQIGMNLNREKSLEVITKQIRRQEELVLEERALLKKNFLRHKTLFEKGAISKVQLEEKEIELINIENQLESVRNSMQNIILDKVAISKENTFLSAEESNRFFELRNIILNSFTNLYREIEDWEKNYVLSSPIEGVLNFYNVRNSNQFLTSEQSVFTVSPKQSQKYYAYLNMPVMNSGKVIKGQKVIIKLDDYPFTEYGVLQGKVNAITKVPLEGSYLVQVDLENQLKTSSNKLLDGRFELEGSAEIITKERSLLNRIYNFLKNTNN